MYAMQTTRGTLLRNENGVHLRNLQRLFALAFFPGALPLVAKRLLLGWHAKGLRQAILWLELIPETEVYNTLALLRKRKLECSSVTFVTDCTILVISQV